MFSKDSAYPPESQVNSSQPENGTPADPEPTHYARFPFALFDFLDGDRLQASDFKVLLSMQSGGGHSRLCFMAQDTIARMCRTSRKSIQRSLARLQSLGLIVHRQNPHKKTDEWLLVWMDKYLPRDSASRNSVPTSSPSLVRHHDAQAAPSLVRHHDAQADGTKLSHACASPVSSACASPRRTTREESSTPIKEESKTTPSREPTPPSSSSSSGCESPTPPPPSSSAQKRVNQGEPPPIPRTPPSDDEEPTYPIPDGIDLIEYVASCESKFAERKKKFDRAKRDYIIQQSKHALGICCSFANELIELHERIDEATGGGAEPQMTLDIKNIEAWLDSLHHKARQEPPQHPHNGQVDVRSHLPREPVTTHPDAKQNGFTQINNEEPFEPYKPGDRLGHTVYGMGTVLTQDDPRKTTIQFDSDECVRTFVTANTVLIPTNGTLYKRRI